MSETIATAITERVARLRALVLEAYAISHELSVICEKHGVDATTVPAAAIDGWVSRASSEPRQAYAPPVRRQRAMIAPDEDRDRRIRSVLLRGPLGARGDRASLRMLIERCADIPGASPGAVRRVAEELKAKGFVRGERGQYWRAA